LWNVSRTSGLTRETAGNPQLRPSFTREQEVGIDMIAFNNKVQLELVYANQVSSDQIIIVPATVATGYSSVRANAGVLTGHTLEATLQYNAIRNQNLQWTISATADKTDTRLTEWERSCYFGVDQPEPVQQPADDRAGAHAERAVPGVLAAYTGGTCGRGLAEGAVPHGARPDVRLGRDASVGDPDAG
jgi:hypothetical protein